MKVVINTCFGGFGLSPLAVKRYGELKGIPLYMYAEYGGHLRQVSYDKEPPFVPYYYTIPNLTEWQDEYCFHERDIPRDDPILIRVVEELGDKANGEYAKLSIIEIPDEVDWEISEYDGNESIEEVHRSWR